MSIEAGKEKIVQADIFGAEQGKQEPGLELVKGPELDAVVDVANDLSGKVEGDREAIVDDLIKLDEALGHVKVKVGGEIMTVEEAREIPDLKMNMEIWRKIESGFEKYEDTKKMTFVTPEILLKLVQGKSGSGGSLGLNGLRTLTDELAQIIGDNKFVNINLDGIEDASESVLEKLSKQVGLIDMKGLEDIPERIIIMAASDRTFPINFSGKIENAIRLKHNQMRENKK